jgi:ATP-dependent protease HslVU (ClpYQ) ATPase subunit
MTDFSPGEIIRYERDHFVVGRAVAKRSIAIAPRNPTAKGA